MKLAELLATLPPEQLQRLSAEHIRSEEPLSRPTLCSMLEGVLRSVRLVQEIVLRRQPPTLSILCSLLDVPNHTLPRGALREVSVRQAEQVCEAVTSGTILGRDEQLRLYRRVLCEARRSDLQIDESESMILGVLRRELEIAHVEHFLIEHHADLQEFWRHADSFDHELNALVSVGLVFERELNVMIASDVAPLIRQALGIDMAAEPTRRLYAALGSSDLVDALERIDARTGGTKDERVDRLLSNWVQPRFVLRPLALDALRELCRAIDAPTSGSKEDLIERLIARYATGSDQAVPSEPPPAPVREERALDERRFKLLFATLKGAELARVLDAFPDLRQSGTKETRGATLWESHRSETTLLSNLTNRDLEDVLLRCRLKLGGSKPERVQRLIEYVAAVDPDTTMAVPDGDDPSVAPGQTFVGGDDLRTKHDDREREA